ncbi:hypothetical protein L1887_51526 [Cichorium endivia]|nr:hypothetical protein L1887_51526 [Cichorium endivia]
MMSVLCPSSAHRLLHLDDPEEQVDDSGRLEMGHKALDDARLLLDEFEHLDGLTFQISAVDLGPVASKHAAARAVFERASGAQSALGLGLRVGGGSRADAVPRCRIRVVGKVGDAEMRRGRGKGACEGDGLDVSTAFQKGTRYWLGIGKDGVDDGPDLAAAENLGSDPLDDARLSQEVDELLILGLALLEQVIFVEDVLERDVGLVEQRLERRDRRKAESPLWRRTSKRERNGKGRSDAEAALHPQSDGDAVDLAWRLVQRQVVAVQVTALRSALQRSRADELALCQVCAVSIQIRAAADRLEVRVEKSGLGRFDRSMVRVVEAMSAESRAGAVQVFERGRDQEIRGRGLSYVYGRRRESKRSWRPATRKDVDEVLVAVQERSRCSPSRLTGAARLSLSFACTQIHSLLQGPNQNLGRRILHLLLFLGLPSALLDFGACVSLMHDHRSRERVIWRASRRAPMPSPQGHIGIPRP